ncbi:MAG: glycosyltransferase [Candidatus Hydrogenedentes bacterium]|nr:glycosyltransferase [Candidatus Hydrogenedentota bacterium]
MKIGAALIVRNEERCLRRCLESLREVADEIVAADTGSTDGTPAIAREFSDRFLSIPWQDDFATARNAVLDRVEGDYVLAIDADEWVTHPLDARQRLDAFVATHTPDTIGSIEIRNAVHTISGPGEVILHAPRFFAREHFRYTGAIHEQLLALQGGRHIETTGVIFGHSGYAQDPCDPAHKSHRNKRILLKEIAQHPNDEYCWFQLGKACFALRAYADAIAAFERALAIIRFEPGAPPMGLHGPVAADVLADLLSSVAYAYANNGGLDSAVDTLEAHRALGHPGVAFADVSHALGYAYLMRGDVPRARAAYEEALRWGASREQVVGTGSFASYYHLGLLAEAVDDVPRAVAHYLEALRLNPAYRPAIARCLDLTVERPGCLPEDWRQCADPDVLRAELEQRQNVKEEGGAVALHLREERKV